MEEGIYYMHIENPLEIRKTILESDRMIIESFKHFESYKRIKQQKLALMEEVKAVLQELNEDNKQLQAFLPKVKKPKAAQLKKKEAKLKKVKTEAEPVHFAELEELEEQISDIEQELKNLS